MAPLEKVVCFIMDEKGWIRCFESGETGLGMEDKNGGRKICFFFFSLSYSGFKKMLPQGVTKGPERLPDFPKVTQAFRCPVLGLSCQTQCESLLSCLGERAMQRTWRTWLCCNTGSSLLGSGL